MFGDKRRSTPSPAAAPRPKPAAPAWPWLAPAMALFLVTFGLMHPTQPNGQSHQLVAAPDRAYGAVLPSNGLIAYLVETVHSPHNNCQIASFEWTKQDQSLSTAAPVSGTNTLFQ